MALPDSDLLLRSSTALGHGTTDNIHYVVYVRPETFSSFNNRRIAAEIADINRRLSDSGEGYLLIGPGRWGSSDDALGVPVRWADIAGARLIVETALHNYRIEPSQGTHFFQNPTSFGVGYFTVNPFGKDDYLDQAFLDAQEAEYESEYVRVVRFESPIVIGIDGRRTSGVVAKPRS